MQNHPSAALPHLVAADARTSVMADEAEIERVGAALDEKTKAQVCPFCQTGNWFLIDKENLSTGLLLSNGTSIRVYTLACTNCGFVRQHLRQVLSG